MGWHKLVFKQSQPIHVGAAKWGVINETEIFIPGQTMWGALTNKYLQNKKDEIDINNENKLKEVRTYFEKISNFFPSFNGKNILQPTYQNGEFGYLVPDTEEFLPEEKFRFYFIDTIVQTAIEPLSRGAKDESLHELDFILPQPKMELEKFNDCLYWIGIICVDDKFEDFLKNLKNIFVGADVRYGYGELELIHIKKLNDSYKEFWLEKNMDNNDNENDNNYSIEIKIKTNEPSSYFIEVEENLEIEGEIHIIPEMDFRENIPRVTDARFFTSVGSKIKIENSLTYNLYKGKLIKENQNANSN